MEADKTLQMTVGEIYNGFLQVLQVQSWQLSAGGRCVTAPVLGDQVGDKQPDMKQLWIQTGLMADRDTVAYYMGLEQFIEDSELEF